MFTYLSILLLTIAAVLPQQACSQSDESEGGALYGGDIMLTPEQQITLEATSNPNDPFSPQNAVVRNARSLWPGGKVPYILDGSINDRARNAIMSAINTYATQSCIRFTPRGNEADYVRFYRGNGCFSFIGRIGGPQDISIGQGCEFEGVVIHEMFHALGRWHEQSRPDRDMYVRINRGNIRSGTESNFEITNPSFVTTQSIRYDIGSIMHYSARAFSSNGNPTIVPVDPNVPLSDLGQRQRLSALDLQHVTTLYCRGSTVSSWSSWSSWSACSRTCNGGARSRTRTCVGGTSCEGSNIQNQQCGLASCPAASSWGAWSSWSGCSASCGGGRQRRVRNCIGGNNCVGVNNQFRDCNTVECLKPATWGSWGSWSSCSSTCQGGFRQRRRTCQNGNTCSGASFENQNCNTNVSCVTQPNPNSGEWSSWSACTAQCGGGERFRTRLCSSSSNCEQDSESCNTQDCQPEPTLRGIQYRGCWYLNTRTRLGTLEGRNRDLSDNPFSRTNPVSKCGLAAQNGSFFLFGVSLGYCISGSNRLADYQYVQSSLCRDGRGGYSRGYFIMDVFEISNQRSFMDSVAGIPEGGEGGGASAGAVSSTVLILVATILGLVTIL